MAMLTSAPGWPDRGVLSLGPSQLPRLGRRLRLEPALVQFRLDPQPLEASLSPLQLLEAIWCVGLWGEKVRGPWIVPNVPS
jgi:hypothetical protein